MLLVLLLSVLARARHVQCIQTVVVIVVVVIVAVVVYFLFVLVLLLFKRDKIKLSGADNCPVRNTRAEKWLERPIGPRV